VKTTPYADGHGTHPTDPHRTTELPRCVGIDTDAVSVNSGRRADHLVYDGGSPMSDEEVQTHTIRLELVDEPGELLGALEPIANAGGNLMSIYHERGNVTPRGHIPVEVDVSCTPDRFERIVDSLRDAGVNVIQAGSERYDEELVVLLVGHLVDTDLSDTLKQVESCANASLTDLSLSSPRGRDESSSARLRLKTKSGTTADALGKLREIAAEKELHVIEPLTEAEG